MKNSRKRKLASSNFTGENEGQNNNKNHSPSTSAAGGLVNSSLSSSSSSSSSSTGWRVKLYCLNTDGSWNDCGTGRILCLYKNNTSPVTFGTSSPINNNNNNNNNKENDNDNSNNKNPSSASSLYEQVYQELGEPTFCVHAEQDTSKILLRTRILLRDAYQRQGENIITWCEPYYYNNDKNNNKTNNRSAATQNNNNSTTGPQDDNTTRLPGKDNQKAPPQNCQTNTNASNSSSSTALEQQQQQNKRHAVTKQTTPCNNKTTNDLGNVSICCASDKQKQQDPQQQQQQQQQQGVDLALSFQDHAGCMDVWRQITQVQSRAANWFRSHGIQPPQQLQSQYQQEEAQRQQQQQLQQQSPRTQQRQQQQQQSVTDMAQAVAAAHHASLQRQQQHAMWVNVASEHFQQQSSEGLGPNNNTNNNALMVTVQQQQQQHDAEAVAVSMAAAAAAVASGTSPVGVAAPTATPTELPNPPTLNNLEEIADVVAAAQPVPQQRESLCMFMSQSDCVYIKALLQLFDPAESVQDYRALATLAACVKSILLLNDPSIIDWLVNNEVAYEQTCATLEYDPDLREKANHRWFLRERAKFRTVVPMQDEELIHTIHRSFRVTYLRDTLLRPTMDESSLSTLASLQTFTHADVVKGVTCPLKNAPVEGDSYLVQVMRMFGKEVKAIVQMEWQELEQRPPSTPRRADSPTIVVKTPTTAWKQHLAPQDDSLASRKIRRRGCLSFFRELFNMVRLSLQQGEKDDFYAAMVCMEVDLDPIANGATPPPNHDANPVNILSLLGAVLSDPTADVTEKGCVLEIIGAVAMHDPSHIRRHCLEYHEIWKHGKRLEQHDWRGPGRPLANERRQIIFRCPPHDLLASLLFLLSVETDAGILLQTSEIMRLVLDTEMLSEHGLVGGIGGGGGGGETEEGSAFLQQQQQHNNVPPNALGALMEQPLSDGFAANASGELGNNNNNADNKAPLQQESDQNQFLSLFYEHYVQWLVAPFQFTILYPARRFPDAIMLNQRAEQQQSPTFQRIQEKFKSGVSKDETLLRIVPSNAIRGSFAVELTSFCVRAHLYRMKFFLLRSRVLSNVLKILNPNANKNNNNAGGPNTPTATISMVAGDRCLKLAALRLLRSILSVKDEFYHRHIIQHNLFAPVFLAFRSNPIGDNLVSSAIVEMVDFIRSQNIKSLIDYIVLKHLSEKTNNKQKSLEDVATPYVSTLTTLRQVYEDGLHHAGSNRLAAAATDNLLAKRSNLGLAGGGGGLGTTLSDSSASIHNHDNKLLSEKALEDQRKFREADAEESFFDADDDSDEYWSG